MTSGLKAYYQFENNADDSFGGHNGSPKNGVNYSSGVSGRGASFDGGTGFIQLPSSTINDMEQGTVSVWINLNNYNGGNAILDKTTTREINDFQWTVSYPHEGYKQRIFIDAGYTTSAGEGQPFYGNTTIPLNSWVHVSITWDENGRNFYYNGSPDGQHSGVQLAVPDSDRNLYIGKVDDGTMYFNGHMDELRIYSRALSSSDIRQLYNLHVSNSIDTGLVAHYEFEDNTFDSEGSHDGNAHGGVSYTNGILGQAASFDGEDDYIEISASSDFDLEVFSLASWVRFDSDQSQQTIVNHGENSSDINQYGLGTRDLLESYCAFEDYNENTYIVTTPELSTGVWYHMVGTRASDGTTKIYLNGQEINSRSFSALPAPMASTLYIGARNNNGYGMRRFLDGDLDELRIYNRALSPAEVQQLYNLHSDAVQNEIAPSNPFWENTKSSTTGTAANSCSDISSSPGPVVASSGNYYHTHNDFIIPSLGPDLNITRYYNSQDLYDGPFGHGWNMDYTAQLIIAEEDDGATSATVRLGNGVRRKFTLNQDGSFTSPVNSDDTLVNSGTTEDPVYLFNGKCGSCGTKPRIGYTFDAGGFLTAIADPNDNQLTVGYDGQGRIASVTDANSRSLAITYGSNGRINTITDFSSRSWIYGYDGGDNLVSVTDPLGNEIDYQYDSNHNLTAVVDGFGNIVSDVGYTDGDRAQSFTNNGGSYQLDYDPVTRVTSKTNPAGGLFQFEYDNNGNITNKTGPLGRNLSLTWDTDINVSSKTDGRNVQTEYSYDDFHNVTEIIRDAGVNGLQLTSSFVYDSVTGKVNQITDFRGNISTMSYDANGNMLTRTMPIGGVTNTYTEEGLLQSITDADGVQTSFSYDENGYLLRSWIENSDPIIESTFTYDGRGNRLTSTDPNGVILTYTYDRLDRLTQMEDGLSNVVQFAYDRNSNLTQLTDAKGMITTFTYDAYNRLITKTEAVGTSKERITSYTYNMTGNLLSVTDPLNHTTSYIYDALSRVIGICDHMDQCFQFGYDVVGNMVSKTDPNGNVTEYTFDALNRLASVTDAEDNTTSYTYDENSNLLTVTDANSNTATTNIFDENNRLTSTSDALNFTTSRTYSPGGRVLTSTDANGQTTTYTYDADTGRLTSIEYPGSKTHSFTYNPGGQLLTSTDSETGLILGYSYDGLGRLAMESQLGHDLNYSYDENGNRVSLSVTNIGEFTYGYDELNRLISITDPGSQTTSFTYNLAGLRTGITYGNGSYTDFSYDTVNRLTEIAHYQADATEIGGFSYTYDSMNNRLSETNANGTIAYIYDKTYKLLSAAYPDGETISFTYDGTGNRLTRSDNAGTVTYDYDIANRLTTATYPDGSTDEYTWDGNGNIQTKKETRLIGVPETTQYTYNGLNQLTSMAMPFSLTNSYGYDPAGRRFIIHDGTDTTFFLYDGQNPLADFSGSQASPVYQNIYTPALGLDVLASRKQGSSTQYYLRDGLNSVRFVLNSDETMETSYNYQPYGAIRNQTGVSDNSFTYTGRRAESNNDLMHYRTRYYDPGVGRFLKKDGFKGKIEEPLSMHRYGYVHGNPINFSDPLGLYWYRQDDEEYVVGRNGTFVPEGGLISRLIEDYTPGGHTFGAKHDNFVGKMHENGVPDMAINIPSMPYFYGEALGEELAISSWEIGDGLADKAWMLAEKISDTTSKIGSKAADIISKVNVDKWSNLAFDAASTVPNFIFKQSTPFGLGLTVKDGNVMGTMVNPFPAFIKEEQCML